MAMNHAASAVHGMHARSPGPILSLPLTATWQAARPYSLHYLNCCRMSIVAGNETPEQSMMHQDVEGLARHTAKRALYHRLLHLQIELPYQEALASAAATELSSSAKQLTYPNHLMN